MASDGPTSAPETGTPPTFEALEQQQKAAIESQKNPKYDPKNLPGFLAAREQGKVMAASAPAAEQKTATAVPEKETDQAKRIAEAITARWEKYEPTPPNVTQIEALSKFMAGNLNEQGVDEIVDAFENAEEPVDLPVEPAKTTTPAPIVIENIEVANEDVLASITSFRQEAGQRVDRLDNSIQVKDNLEHGKVIVPPGKTLEQDEMHQSANAMRQERGDIYSLEENAARYQHYIENAEVIETVVDKLRREASEAEVAAKRMKDLGQGNMPDNANRPFDFDIIAARKVDELRKYEQDNIPTEMHGGRFSLDNPTPMEKAYAEQQPVWQAAAEKARQDALAKIEADGRNLSESERARRVAEKAAAEAKKLAETAKDELAKLKQELEQAKKSQKAAEDQANILRGQAANLARERRNNAPVTQEELAQMPAGSRKVYETAAATAAGLTSPDANERNTGSGSPELDKILSDWKKNIDNPTPTRAGENPKDSKLLHWLTATTSGAGGVALSAGASAAAGLMVPGGAQIVALGLGAGQGFKRGKQEIGNEGLAKTMGKQTAETESKRWRDRFKTWFTKNYIQVEERTARKITKLEAKRLWKPENDEEKEAFGALGTMLSGKDMEGKDLSQGTQLVDFEKSARETIKANFENISDADVNTRIALMYALWAKNLGRSAYIGFADRDSSQAEIYKIVLSYSLEKVRSFVKDLDTTSEENKQLQSELIAVVAASQVSEQQIKWLENTYIGSRAVAGGAKAVAVSMGIQGTFKLGSEIIGGFGPHAPTTSATGTPPTAGGPPGTGNQTNYTYEVKPWTPTTDHNTAGHMFQDWIKTGHGSGIHGGHSIWSSAYDADWKSFANSVGDISKGGNINGEQWWHEAARIAEFKAQHGDPSAADLFKNVLHYSSSTPGIPPPGAINGLSGPQIHKVLGGVMAGMKGVK